MWYAIEKRIKTWLLTRFSPRRPDSPLKPSDLDGAVIQRLLIVRQHDQFGDFLLTTPAIRALRLKFPQAHIALVVRDYLYPVAKDNPDVDEIIIFHESAWRWTPRRIVAFIRCIRQPYDLAVVFNTVSHSLSSDMIAYFSRARMILGPASPLFDYMDYNPFYTLNAPVDPAPKHQTLRNMDVVRYIGAETEDLSYGFSASDQEQAEGRRVKEHLLGAYESPVLAIHFGTKDPKKRYPLSRLAAVCDGISDAGKFQIIVIPAPDEERLLTELKTGTRATLHIAPHMSLRQLAGFLKTVDLLLCNDTGVLHLAAAVRIPTLSFHAISDPALWKPVGPRHVALYAVDGDINRIEVETVIETIHDRGESQEEIVIC